MYCIDSSQKYVKQYKKINALIVDDDDDSRNALKNIISLHCNVITIDDGLKCINRCSEVAFDVIFLDFHINDMLSNLDGADICKLIQECFNIKNTLIFAYTGDNSLFAITKFKNANMQGAFIKPVSHKLMANFLFIVENETVDKNSLFKRLALKNKNFIYFD